MNANYQTMVLRAVGPLVAETPPLDVEMEMALAIETHPVQSGSDLMGNLGCELHRNHPIDVEQLAIFSKKL